MPDDFDYVVIGAGISGLGFANWIRERAPGASVVVLEREAEPGGYCRTVLKDGFVWDYSGHFFHFKHPEIEAWLRARMPGQRIDTITKLSSIRYAGRDIDFPFQKNIHQLPQAEFIECLYDLYFRPPSGGGEPTSFLDMLYRKLGRAITEKFLRPYNEKLYATDLDTLDPDAMGRFFPHAEIADIIGNMKPGAKAGGYNATFTYPAGGAIEYVKALLHDIPGVVALGEDVVGIDRDAHTVTTSKREIRYKHLVSSTPLPALLRMCGVTPLGAAGFTSNKVLVYNLGFDRKGPRAVHWMYFPDRALSFYRVGFYDNIFDSDRMSLYVEIGLRHDEQPDVAAMRERVLADLARENIVDGHQLVAHHDVILDPAYVHITKDSLRDTARYKAELAADDIHTVGRYGGWTYCSIEDNLVETRELASELTRVR